MASSHLAFLDPQVDVAALSRLCEEFGVRELAAFGSRMMGSSRKDSDLDLLYELLPSVQLGWDIQELEDRLSDLFDVPVDLVSKKYLHRQLRDRVLAEAKVIYAA